MATAQETYAMLEQQSLWATALRCHQLLAAAGVPHAVVGGVAVCLHGYRRNTTDVDLLVPREQRALSQACLDVEGLLAHFSFVGDRVGPSSEVRLPHPGERNWVQMIEGLPALSLARPIEVKIARGKENPRRTHRDFADVVELIAVNQLRSRFGHCLHPSVRRTFNKLVMHSRGEG
jgi:hypothetical protein